jgi:2-amino-4-hydroxy-6-hydroxymethyldihydropteridine diphosphokinase
MIYLSLGSNLGERAAQMRDAVRRLRGWGRVVAISSLYETEPVEFREQPWFLNCAVELETTLEPQELMDSLLRIEEEMGRRRERKKGPRAIDLDILLYDRVVMTTERLVIPHPAMQERRFVLQPLAEIAPQVRHPLFGKTIMELRDGLPPGQEVKRMGAADWFQEPRTKGE